MKANYLTHKRAQRELNALVDKTHQKTCEKCLERLNRDFIETSAYNVKFHLVHLLCVLHDEFGFGKVRLNRLLQAYNDADKAFKADLDDGIAWTKAKRRLEEIGLEFDDEESAICDKKERLFEKGITYYDKKKRRR
jgi:hypothetical protein